MRDRIADCLNASELREPTKRDIRETIEFVIGLDICDSAVETLIGEILRSYQRWPRLSTKTDDFAWLQQAIGTKNGHGFGTILGGGGWLYTSDGHRVHRVVSAHNTGDNDHSANSLACAAVFKDLIRGPCIHIGRFRNVTEDLVELDGHVYQEWHILQAFSGSETMAAAPTSNGLYLANGGREAIVQEMRI